MSRQPLKQKQTKIAIIIMLALIICASLILPHQVAGQIDQTEQYCNKSFAWDYNGNYWTWNLSIPMAVYDAYKSVPVSTRTGDGPAGYGFCTTTKDPYIQSLAEELNETTNSEGYNSYDQVSFVLAFVQSLPYTSDNVTEGYNEYPRFPIETLVDGGGDCEDTSILFATLTLILGYGTVYINPPDHYAVGILGDHLGGTYWTYPKDSNKTYYFCETTGNGFKIGELPDEFQGESAYIYPIDENKQYVSDITILPTPKQIQTTSPINTATPTIQPNPTDSSSGGGPSIQPPEPLSFDLVFEQPGLFAIFLLVIVLSISLAVWSVRRSKGTSLPLSERQPSVGLSASHTDPQNSEASKFCIFCGSSNKAYAVYCEQCGKKIG
jgi:hypothetical protein